MLVSTNTTYDYNSNGNILTDGTILEQNDYYPFGLRTTRKQTYITLSQSLASSTAPRYLYNGKEKQEFIHNTGSLLNAAGSATYTSNYIDYGARFYNPVTLRWTTQDPLAEKYMGYSPYAYCVNNPINFVDSAGYEKLDVLFGESKKNDEIREAFAKFEDNGAIHILAHGSKDGKYFTVKWGDGSKQIRNADDLNEFLSEFSSVWKNRNNEENKDKGITIVLHSCHMGEGDNSLAKQISTDLLFKDVEIVAPNTTLLVENKKEIGPYEAENKIISGSITPTLVRTNRGKWAVFKNGENVQNHRYNWHPDVGASKNKFIESIKYFYKMILSTHPF